MKFSLSRDVILVLLLVICSPLIAVSATANPPGVPAGSKLAYKFNMIGRPGIYSGNCGGGDRLFVLRDARGAHILVTNGPSWNVTDCNATGDHWGAITTNEVNRYNVYMRILGKLGGHLRICGDTYTDYLSGETLCLLGTIDLTRGSGQSKFQVAPSAMFDASLEDIIWTVDTNSDFRIVQFRIYAMP
jgi:hypothetical protein